MKISMNGFRRSFSGDVKNLRDVVSSIKEGDCYDIEDLIQATNKIISNTNILNAISVDSDPDFSEMSEIDINHIQCDEWP